MSVVYRLIVSHLLHIQGDTHRRARTHRPWHPADTPQYERQRQQPGSCEASTRQPSHPQRVGFASESASILCVQLDTRCADFGLQPMELGQGLRASLRTATCRSSSIRAGRIREFRVSDLLRCGGVQCAGRRGRLWPRAAHQRAIDDAEETQTLLSLVSARPLFVRQSAYQCHIADKVPTERTRQRYEKLLSNWT